MLELALVEVSDSHPVASHAVCPTLPLLVNDAMPIPDPCTVTLADPVPARLLCLTTLSDGPSTLHAAVKLPDLSPTVIDTRLVP